MTSAEASTIGGGVTELRPETVWTVIQARTGSTRRPGKVLAEFPGGPTMLDWVVARAKDIGYPVALAIPEGDTELARVCVQRDWLYVEGPEDDVLARYAKACRELSADHIIRVTADCPFLDPWAARVTVAHHLECGADLTWDYAEGRGVQVFTAQALYWADKQAVREDRHSPDLYLIDLHKMNRRAAVEYMKFSVDTEEELEQARRRADAV